MAHICCSPPDMVPAIWRRALLHAREQVEHDLQPFGELGARLAA